MVFYVVSLARTDVGKLEHFGRVYAWLAEHGARFDGWSVDPPGHSGPLTIEGLLQLPEGASVSVNFDVQGKNSPSFKGELTCRRPMGGASPHEPVRLITSGPGYPDDLARSGSGKHAQTVNRVFVELCETLDPTYASVDVEHEMESPEELVAKGLAEGFADVYLSERLISSGAIEGLLGQFPFVKSKRLVGGHVLYSRSIFNPSVRSGASAGFSMAASRLVASALRAEGNLRA